MGISGSSAGLFPMYAVIARNKNPAAVTAGIEACTILGEAFHYSAEGSPGRLRPLRRSDSHIKDYENKNMKSAIVFHNISFRQQLIMQKYDSLSIECFKECLEVCLVSP